MTEDLITMKIGRETHARLRYYVAKQRAKTNDEGITALLDKAGVPKKFDEKDAAEIPA